MTKLEIFLLIVSIIFIFLYFKAPSNKELEKLKSEYNELEAQKYIFKKTRDSLNIIILNKQSKIHNKGYRIDSIQNKIDSNYIHISNKKEKLKNISNQSHEIDELVQKLRKEL